MESEPTDEDYSDDDWSQESDSTENDSERNDLEDEGLEELCQTTTTPEFLQWREQVQEKLSLLEKSMNPLAARTQYNFENSPMYSAPDEILLMAMRYLDDEDKAAFFSLRQVSRPGGRRGDPVQLDEAASRLRRDLLCASCQRGYSNRKSHGLSAACKFGTHEQDKEWLHCSGCKVDHRSTVFTSEEKMKPQNERLCIGRQGYVRLCEHEVITWTDIEACLAQARREPSTRPRKLVEIRVCEIPGSGHKQRLGYNISGRHEATLLCADTPEFARFNFSLQLKWRVHLERVAAPEMGMSRPPTTEEMQAMAQVLRLEGAGSILPAEGPFHLPEMDCFSAPWDCCRLRHGVQKGAEQATSKPITRLPLEEIWTSEHAVDGTCTGPHAASIPSWRGGLRLAIRSWRGPLFRESGLEFTYGKIFSVDDKKTNVYGADGVTLTPNHDWYHAMDRNSYSWQGGCGALESCENRSCRNHYNLTPMSLHFEPDISRNCECELEGTDGEDQEEGYETE
ncbi:hypothetical protein CDV36_015262 [Fusarium kuroshium]|uniref:F-box domain-containing protein n=1 Tax=Fusarium kuroshium TaxID=2010991 RepID=A0A3M2RBB1_9HYPO|nr:hypothetical protein CDV36_015262 [Fusarium kuroshium]